MTAALAALAIGAGLALAVVGVLVRARERDAALRAVLDLPYGEDDAGVERSSDSIAALFGPGVTLAHKALERFNLVVTVAEALQRARIPLRPGEFVFAAAGAGVAGGLFAWLLTGQVLVGVMTSLLLLYASWLFVTGKAERRRKAFETQLPEALALTAASLEAGHTFLRSIEMMMEEAEAPLSEEFERVVAETRLGDPLIDALQRMSDRMRVEDLAWVVQAIRIQQSVGGKLGELLSTLAEFMRAREEIRREVRVLTAEGRMSANVLGALPVVVFMVIKTTNPEYLNTMFRGGGLIALAGAAASILLGMGMIRKMARIDV